MWRVRSIRNHKDPSHNAPNPIGTNVSGSLYILPATVRMIITSQVMMMKPSINTREVCIEAFRLTSHDTGLLSRCSVRRYLTGATALDSLD